MRTDWQGSHSWQGYKPRLYCSPPPVALGMPIVPGLGNQTCRTSVQSFHAQSMSRCWTGKACQCEACTSSRSAQPTSANPLLKLNSRAEGQVPAGCDSLARGAPRPLAQRHAADSCCTDSVRQLPNCDLALLCFWGLLLQMCAFAVLQEWPASSSTLSSMRGGHLAWSNTCGVLQRVIPALPVLPWAVRQSGAGPPRRCFTKHLPPGLCCRRRAVVRLGRRRSDELYAKFTGFPQDDDLKALYANDTVSSFSLGHLQPPRQPWSAAEFTPADDMGNYLRNAGTAALP